MCVNTFVKYVFVGKCWPNKFKFIHKIICFCFINNNQIYSPHNHSLAGSRSLSASSVKTEQTIAIKILKVLICNSYPD